MKIITISDNPKLFSGLAKVHGNVIRHLATAGNEVIPLVWFPYDPLTMEAVKAGAIPPPLEFEGLRMLPMTQNENAPLALRDVVERHRPDVVITIGDYWKFYYVPAVKAKCDFSFKWLGYFTVEEEEIPAKWMPLFRYVDLLASPSMFGCQTLCRHAERDGIFFVPYGTDEVFVPASLEYKERLKTERGASGKTRFVTVAQNTPRKCLPSIVQVARRLKETGDDRASFYIHTNNGASDSTETYAYDLAKIIEKLDVSDRVFLPDSTVSVFSGRPEEDLVNEYHASDFYLCSSLSEGYGLPVVEAMACGLPVLANPSTSLPELLGAEPGQYGKAPRGWISRGRMEVFPPDIIAETVEPTSMSEDVSALCDRGPSSFSDCSKWAKGRTWEGMGDALCEILEQATSRVVLPVEELSEQGRTRSSAEENSSRMASLREKNDAPAEQHCNQRRIRSADGLRN